MRTEKPVRTNPFPWCAPGSDHASSLRVRTDLVVSGSHQILSIVRTSLSTHRVRSMETRCVSSVPGEVLPVVLWRQNHLLYCILCILVYFCEGDFFLNAHNCTRIVVNHFIGYLLKIVINFRKTFSIAIISSVEVPDIFANIFQRKNIPFYSILFFTSYTLIDEADSLYVLDNGSKDDEEHDTDAYIII